MTEKPPSDLRERVFLFAQGVNLFTRDLSKGSGQARDMAEELAAAAASVGSNLEEAKAAFSRRDFAGKNSIALKEMREAFYWLRLIEASQLASPESVQPLLDEARF